MGERESWRRTGHHLLTEEISTTLDDRGRRRAELLVDDARQAGDETLVGRLELVADAAAREDAVHPC
jgi:hypothetical protein